MTDTSTVTDHRVVSRDAWLKERKALLAEEKEMTHLRDKLSAKRRELPWTKVEKAYAFDTPDGPKTLADLFNGRSQLIVKHFMLAPGQKEGCVGCSFEVDHIEGALQHIEHHDVSFVSIARAPVAEIEAFKKRMGWHFRWVSSYASDFNYDFNVSFTPEQMKSGKAVYNYQETEVPLEDLSGISIFYKDEKGDIFHTYSAFGRGAKKSSAATCCSISHPRAATSTAPISILRTGCGIMTAMMLRARLVQMGDGLAVRKRRPAIQTRLAKSRLTLEKHQGDFECRT